MIDCLDMSWACARFIYAGATTRLAPLLMALERAFLTKATTALATFKGQLASVDSSMFGEVATLTESLVTAFKIAAKGSFTRVYPEMNAQRAGNTKSFVAKFATKLGGWYAVAIHVILDVVRVRRVGHVMHVCWII